MDVRITLNVCLRCSDASQQKETVPENWTGITIEHVGAEEQHQEEHEQLTKLEDASKTE